MLLLVAVNACKAKPDPVPQGTGTSTASAAARSAGTTAATAVSAVAAAPAGLPEEDVKGFVARWAAAQNDHDFETYSRLYADRFMGVKRVGTYSKRFDRAAWLLDRKPMLAGSAKLTVTDLTLAAAAAGSTRAMFTQEFVSPGFRDTGRKELFLVSSPSGIQISREEMLSSEVSASAPSDESILAYHRDGAVLQRSFSKAALKTQPKLLSGPNASPIEIGFDVPADALTEGARAWLGREITAYTTSGQTCTGRVARFQVRVQAVPHFGMRQSWNGELDAPKATPEEIAKTIQGMAQNEEHFVVGVLDRPCAGTWASSASHAFVAAVPSTGKVREAGVAAFKALPGYSELQRRFVKEAGAPQAAWETVEGALNVLEVRSPARPPLLLVTARGGAGCASFSGALSAFWEIGGTTDAPKLTATIPPVSQFLTLRGALDQGGAGGQALLAGPDNYDDEVAVLRLTTPKAPRRVLFSTSFWDCDC